MKQFRERTLTNVDIERRMHRTPGWLGVFSRDTVPDLGQPGGFSLVLNLNRSHEPGSHWVALFHEAGGRYVEYFDSFGVAPPQEVLRARHGRPLMYSSSTIQDLRSSSCGWYCIDFLRARLRGTSMLEYLGRWNEAHGQRRSGAENEQRLHR